MKKDKTSRKDILSKIQNFYEETEATSIKDREQQISKFLNNNKFVVVPKVIGGKTYLLKRLNLPLKYLYLDDKNRREWSILSKNQKTQYQIFGMLEEPSFIKEIYTNGGLMEEIYAYSDGRIPEGNRRDMVYVWLHNKYPNDDKWKTIPTLILPDNISNNDMNLFLLSTHYKGKKRWGSWEEISMLSDIIKDGAEKSAIADHCGLSQTELNHILQAFDMVEGYGEYDMTDENYRKTFSYFQEAITKRNMIIDSVYFRATYGKFKRGDHNSFDAVPAALAAFKEFIQKEVYYLIRKEIIYHAMRHVRYFPDFMSNDGNGILWTELKHVEKIDELFTDLSSKSKYDVGYNKLPSIVKLLSQISEDNQEIQSFADGDNDVQIHSMMDTMEEIQLFLSDKRISTTVKRCKNRR